MNKKIHELDSEIAADVTASLKEFRDHWLYSAASTDDIFGKYLIQVNAGGAAVILAYLASISSGGSQLTWQLLISLTLFGAGLVAAGLRLFSRVRDYVRRHKDAKERFHGFVSGTLPLDQAMPSNSPNSAWSWVHEWSERLSAICIVLGISFGGWWVGEYIVSRLS